MQLEAVLFALILFFIIPIIIVFSNDNVFFIILSLLLLINAFKSINIFNSRKRTSISNNSEFQEEFQQITNIDYKVFTAGLKVAGNFIFITFFIYCFFFINEIILLWPRCIPSNEPMVTTEFAGILSSIPYISSIF